jgi:hypothetical protein
MRVAGIELPTHTAAELGRLLQEAGCVQSAICVGLALKRDRSELTVGPVEYEEILTVLEQDCPAELIELRNVLDGRQHRRAS